MTDSTKKIRSWQEAVDHLAPYVVKISTPRSTGTGFLVSHSSLQPMCGVATAAHVVDHAHYWEQPIRLEHVLSGRSILLKADARAVLIEEDKDTAAIVFSKGDLPLPSETPQLTPEGSSLRVGVEVGWMGFPAVSPKNLCFFSGRVSAFIEKQFAYLVDGVAINGVSGGPTFFLSDEGGLVIIGVVSSYIPNRAAGETLPGLAMIRDVAQFQSLVKQFKNLDDAKEEETSPTQPPPPPLEPAP